ncbi:hypothetical protein BDW02DRAFT_324916 [Decorospora gaudefroyi]|uniref:Uncharacterized protein n=1 Tax=Decorospora gaudefroyi TaxID=184978 RepID=A0A6A5KJZ8_9PLEO|nr:hypothetical protein BDW02DRAFT_324916 [Decorospora gaudefroyi]
MSPTKSPFMRSCCICANGRIVGVVRTAQLISYTTFRLRRQGKTAGELVCYLTSLYRTVPLLSIQERLRSTTFSTKGGHAASFKSTDYAERQQLWAIHRSLSFGLSIRDRKPSCRVLQVGISLNNSISRRGRNFGKPIATGYESTTVTQRNPVPPCPTPSLLTARESSPALEHTHAFVYRSLWLAWLVAAGKPPRRHGISFQSKNPYTVPAQVGKKPQELYESRAMPVPRLLIVYHPSWCGVTVVSDVQPHT